MCQASNADLYKLLFDFIKNKRLDLTVYCMPSHLDNPEANTKKGKPKVRPVWVHETLHDYDIKGNKEVDEPAERAAEIAELPGWLVEPLINNIRMVRLIQLRIATIVCNLPKRNYRKPVCHSYNPTSGKLTKEEAMVNSEHLLRTTEMVVQCSECLPTVRLNSPDFYAFPRTSCVPAVRTRTCNNVSIVGRIRIRNQESHPTHDMYSYRGIQYCNKCG